MRTKLVPVQAFREYAFCSECDGELKPLPHTGADIGIVHQCNGCGAKLMFTVAYPRIVYAEVGVDVCSGETPRTAKYVSAPEQREGLQNVEVIRYGTWWMNPCAKVELISTVKW